MTSSLVLGRGLEKPGNGNLTQHGIRMSHRRNCAGKHCWNCGRCLTYGTKTRTPMCGECKRVVSYADGERFSDIIRRARTEMRLRSR